MKRIPIKVQSFILENQIDALEAGYNLVYLGRDDRYVDFGLIKPYRDAEAIKSMPVSSMCSISVSDMKEGNIEKLIDWLEEKGCSFNVKNQ